MIYVFGFISEFYSVSVWNVYIKIEIVQRRAAKRNSSYEDRLKNWAELKNWRVRCDLMHQYKIINNVDKYKNSESDRESIADESINGSARRF